MSNAQELASRVYLAVEQGEFPSSTLRVAVAAFGDISRFKSGDAAASYLGLTPSTRQSATSVYHGPITKHGNSTARKLAVIAWRLLITGEPYRYAQPKSTETKLAFNEQISQPQIFPRKSRSRI